MAAAGVWVVGVSADPQTRSDAFAESLCLPFPLVGDAGGRITRDYGVRWPLIGLARRVTFAVAPPGIVRAVFRAERDALAHVAFALRSLEG